MAALRDKLAARAAPYLEPGEQLQAIFMVRSGPSPYLQILTYWIAIFGGTMYGTVAVTDRAMVIIRNGAFLGTRPKRLHLRGPRNALLGTPTGLWGKVQLDQRYWVHKRFHRDVVAADNALRAMGGGQPQYQQQAPAQQYAPQQAPAPQQYAPQQAAAPQQYPPQQYPQQGQQYPPQQYPPQGQQYPQQGQQYPR
jgi:hypothetical protein